MGVGCFHSFSLCFKGILHQPFFCLLQIIPEIKISIKIKTHLADNCNNRIMSQKSSLKCSPRHMTEIVDIVKYITTWKFLVQSLVLVPIAVKKKKIADARYPQDMHGRMRTVYPCDSNKGLNLEFPEDTEYDKRFLKKTGEYSGWNIVSITTKMSIAVWNGQRIITMPHFRNISTYAFD